ncbi:hypothetical protein AcW1_006996 [Taiwanofungus camphoratus]|nr:hypothetical protein AcV5_002798 [Antrodia cinnamomea]KAI0955399.1 hypothetical protein AcW1_006996 [Antrodia cinnamomea]
MLMGKGHKDKGRKSKGKRRRGDNEGDGPPLRLQRKLQMLPHEGFQVWGQRWSPRTSASNDLTQTDTEASSQAGTSNASAAASFGQSFTPVSHLPDKTSLLHVSSTSPVLLEDSISFGSPERPLSLPLTPQNDTTCSVPDFEPRDYQFVTAPHSTSVVTHTPTASRRTCAQSCSPRRQSRGRRGSARRHDRNVGSDLSSRLVPLSGETVMHRLQDDGLRRASDPGVSLVDYSQHWVSNPQSMWPLASPAYYSSSVTDASSLCFPPPSSSSAVTDFGSSGASPLVVNDDPRQISWPLHEPLLPALEEASQATTSHAPLPKLEPIYRGSADAYFGVPEIGDPSTAPSDASIESLVGLTDGTAYPGRAAWPLNPWLFQEMEHNPVNLTASTVPSRFVQYVDDNDIDWVHAVQQVQHAQSEGFEDDTYISMDTDPLQLASTVKGQEHRATVSQSSSIHQWLSGCGDTHSTMPS